MLQGWVGNESDMIGARSDGVGDIEKGDILRSSSLPSSVMQAAASRVKEILEREGYTQISIYEELAGDGRTQASSSRSPCGMLNRNKSECKASHIADVRQESRRHSIS